MRENMHTRQIAAMVAIILTCLLFPAVFGMPQPDGEVQKIIVVKVTFQGGQYRISNAEILDGEPPIKLFDEPGITIEVNDGVSTLWEGSFADPSEIDNATTIKEFDRPPATQKVDSGEATIVIPFEEGATMVMLKKDGETLDTFDLFLQESNPCENRTDPGCGPATEKAAGQAKGGAVSVSGSSASSPFNPLQDIGPAILVLVVLASAAGAIVFMKRRKKA